MVIEQRCTCDVAWCDVHHARGTRHDHRPSRAPGFDDPSDRACTADCRPNPPEDTPRRHTFDDRTDIEFAYAVAITALTASWDHPEWAAQECARHAVESETS